MRRVLERSLELRERARQMIVGGGQAHKRSNPPQPVMIERGKRSHIWDADGREKWH